VCIEIACVKEIVMAYLAPADYLNYGLPSGTTGDWVTAATALINSYCRRPDLNVMQYQERLRIVSGTQTVQLSYLPLAAMGAAVSPLVSVQGRYGRPRRGELAETTMLDAALAFSLPGEWTALDPSTVDFAADTGELTLPWNVMGLPYNEVSVTYTAGLTTIGDDVKCACAQIVRNAQAQPSLNTSQTKMDTMLVKYFSSSLLDATVQAWLRPYVANRVG
jgi:hypothetical protein